MKSSEDQLRDRGYLFPDDMAKYNATSIDGLKKLLHSNQAVERSAGARLLASKGPLTPSLAKHFITILAQEKKLYIKLELCAALQTGGPECAAVLVSYLGRIGNNQYQKPQAEEFKKISYPLPRDIVARILVRMHERVLPIVVGILKTGDHKTILEAIDVIGFMCFYICRDRSAKSFALKELTNVLQTYPDDETIRWKIVRSFESFNTPVATEILDAIERTVLLQTFRQWMI